jgi:hypothetical protein
LRDLAADLGGDEHDEQGEQDLAGVVHAARARAFDKDCMLHAASRVMQRRATGDRAASG